MEELNLNSNPLEELTSNIKLAYNLKVLGISYTKMKEIPCDIIKLTELKQICCYGTPLLTPKALIAQRGIEAIFKYFKDIKAQEDAADPKNRGKKDGDENAEQGEKMNKKEYKKELSKKLNQSETDESMSSNDSVEENSEDETV